MPGLLAYGEDADISIELSTHMSPSFLSHFQDCGHSSMTSVSTYTVRLSFHFAVRPGRVSLQNASTRPFPKPGNMKKTAVIEP